MAYETKVLIVTFAKIVNSADSLKDVYETLQDLAAIEGMELKPFKGKPENDPANA
jgi:hypothetical protein